MCGGRLYHRGCGNAAVKDSKPCCGARTDRYGIEKYERIRLEFSTNTSYYSKIREELEAFLKDVENRERILGIGISIPGIVNLENRMLVKSHALQLENYSLNFLEQVFSLPVYFENDANAAMRAEDLNRYKNALYLKMVI